MEGGFKMKNIIVTEIIAERDRYVANATSEIDEEKIGALKDGGRMLVDSDRLAFVYVLEDEQTLYYVRFEEAMWPSLKTFIERPKPFFIRLREGAFISLESIESELRFLIDNIRGNGNYGEKMEKAVQNTFEKR